MKRIQLVGAVIVAMLAITAITATTALAETTKVLPVPTAAEPVSATVTQTAAGKLQQLGGLTVECATATGTIAFTSENLGTGKVNFKTCKGPLSSTCTGEGDLSGEILSEGTVHYLLALEMTTGTSTTLVGAIITLQKEFHFTCEALGVKQLILVKGCIAGRDDSSEKLTKTVLVLYKQFVTGETKILEILPAGSTVESKCLLESSINGAAFTLAALAGEGKIETWIKHEAGGKTKEVEVLLMNK